MITDRNIIQAAVVKAVAKANKYNGQVVIGLAVKSCAPRLQLLRHYTATRQAAIRAGSEGELLIDPTQVAA